MCQASRASLSCCRPTLLHPHFPRSHHCFAPCPSSLPVPYTWCGFQIEVGFAWSASPNDFVEVSIVGNFQKLSHELMRRLERPKDFPQPPTPASLTSPDIRRYIESRWLHRAALSRSVQLLDGICSREHGLLPAHASNTCIPHWKGRWMQVRALRTGWSWIQALGAWRPWGGAGYLTLDNYLPISHCGRQPSLRTGLYRATGTQ